MLKRIPWVLIACALVPLAGCSSQGKVQGVSVNGRLVQNGKPLTFLPSEEVTVRFFSDVPAGQNRIATATIVKPEDATFTITGPTNEGIPAGKYRVDITSQILGGKTNQDRFGNLFDAQVPLIAEVGTEPNQTFLIDVATKTVKKQ